MTNLALKQLFIKSGFTEKFYDGQEGLFLIKYIPTASVIQIRGWELTEDLPDSTVVELCPSGDLQYMIDYDLGMYEKYNWETQRESWLSLAVLAGVDEKALVSI